MTGPSDAASEPGPTRQNRDRWRDKPSYLGRRAPPPPHSLTHCTSFITVWQLLSGSATVKTIDRSYYFFESVPPRCSRVRDRNSRRILESAREMIEEQGLEQLSMRRLASHIDVSVRTLYNLFGEQKGGLLAALVQHSLDAVGTAVLDTPASDPIERLWQVVTISVETMVALPKAVLLAVMSDEELDACLHWRGRAHTVDAVRAAIETGLLRDDLAPPRTRGPRRSGLPPHPPPVGSRRDRHHLAARRSAPRLRPRSPGGGPPPSEKTATRTHHRPWTGQHPMVRKSAHRQQDDVATQKKRISR